MRGGGCLVEDEAAELPIDHVLLAGEHAGGFRLAGCGTSALDDEDEDGVREGDGSPCGAEGGVESVGEDHGRLVGLDLPGRGYGKGCEGGEVGVVEVHLVFKGDGFGRELREVKRVFAGAGGHFGDEGGVCGDLFEDGEVVDADVWGAGIVDAVVDECNLSDDGRFGHRTVAERRTGGFDDGGVKSRCLHVRVSDSTL